MLTWRGRACAPSGRCVVGYVIVKQVSKDVDKWLRSNAQTNADIRGRNLETGKGGNPFVLLFHRFTHSPLMPQPFTPLYYLCCNHIPWAQVSALRTIACGRRSPRPQQLPHLVIISEEDDRCHRRCLGLSHPPPPLWLHSSLWLSLLYFFLGSLKWFH